MDMDNKYDLTCDQCGARMRYNDKRTEIHCDYCGNVVLLPSTEDAEKIAYAKRKAEVETNNKFYEKRERKERRQQRIAKIIAISIVFSLIIGPFISVGITYLFRPKINPFEYIEVTFEGTDSHGVANVELIKTDEKIHNIYDLGVELSKEYNLSNGDVITVYTNEHESPCRHSETSREYTVEGLEP